MKPKQLFLFAVFSAMLQSRICNAQGATTYLDNTGQPITGTGGFNTTAYLTAQFQTGTNANGYVINGLQFLFADAGGSPDFPYLRAYLLSDLNNSPYIFLDTFIPNDNPTNAGLHTFERNQPLFPSVILDANTDYWLFFSPYGGSSLGYYRYSFTDSVNSTSVDGWRITGETYSPYPPAQPGFPMFSINATTIPEPSSVSLLLPMVIAAARYKKFRR
jgi:hypothetical protein